MGEESSTNLVWLSHQSFSVHR